MSRITYEQAFDDHQYLWTIYGPAADMTGAYVDQDDLARLLRNPTKVTARKCLESQIHHWFSRGTDCGVSPPHAMATDPRLVEIAERYGART